MIERACDDYVRGALDLDGLNERLDMLFGLHQPKPPDVTMEEADKRLAAQAQKRFADSEWNRLTEEWHRPRMIVGGGGTIIATHSTPASAYTPPPPVEVETADLVDATGRVIRTVPIGLKR